MELLGGIWYKGEDQNDKSRAFKLLDAIVDAYRKDNIDISTYYPNCAGRTIVRFYNGDSWEVIPSNTTCKGRYFNVTCISKKIQSEEEEARIMGAAHPMFMPDINTYIISKF